MDAMCSSPWTGSMWLSMRFWFGRGMRYHVASLLKKTFKYIVVWFALRHQHCWNMLSWCAFLKEIKLLIFPEEQNTGKWKQAKSNYFIHIYLPFEINEFGLFVIHCVYIQTCLYEQSDSSTAVEKSAKNVRCLKKYLVQNSSAGYLSSRLLHTAS